MNPQNMITFPLGTEQIIFDKDMLTNKQVRQLRMDIAKAVADYDQDMLDIQEKFNKLAETLAEESKKRDKETDKAHEKRVEVLTEQFKKDVEVIKLPEDSYWRQDLAFRILKVIARLGGQEHKVTQENFDAAPANPIRKKLAEFLINEEIDAGTLFLPPKLSEEA
jgi:hypothetical protein